MLSCPSLASDGPFDMTRPADAVYRGEEWLALECNHPSSVTSQGVVDLHAQGAQRQATSSRPRDSTFTAPSATAPSATAPSRTLFSPDMSDYDSGERVLNGQEWPRPAEPYLQGEEHTLRLQFVDLSLHHGHNGCQSLMGASAHNPRWGVSHDHTLPLFGRDSRDLYANELGGYDSFATSGTTSFLESTQSLPGSMLTSSDAWLSRNGEASLQDSSFSMRDRAEASGSTRGIHPRSVSFESSLGQHGDSSAARDGAKVQQGSFAALRSSSGVAGVNLGGGRMEEGCIGSKRRIWYRAPNGQFASATQALSGQIAGDGHDNNGQRSSMSSGGLRRIRRRRKSEEVERKYRCDFDGCDKAYGTLNRKYAASLGSTRFATESHAWRCSGLSDLNLI